MSAIPDLTEHESQQLAALGNRPEWEVLRNLAKQRMESHFDRVAKAFMREGVEPDYARLQWQRGFFAGMKFLLDNPTVEAAKLDRLIAAESKEAQGAGTV